MKRLLKMLLTLFTIYLLIQAAFKLWGSGHEVKYQIKTNNQVFDIVETYVTNTANEVDSYYFDIKYEQNVFSFQTYEDFNNTDMVIEEIKYFENDNYKCILPIFIKGVISMDVMCVKDGNINYYHNIKGVDTELDNFINNLKVKNYNLEQWVDNKKDFNNHETITVYRKNILDNQFIGVNNYKGIVTLNKSNRNLIEEVKLFSKDVYKRDLEVMLNNFYIVANYNSQHEFSNLFVVNLMDNRQDNIRSNKKISFNSYIQGVVDNSVYIYDVTNKKQYEVDIKTKKVLEVGNADTEILYYNNGDWERIDISELAKKKLLFTTNETSSSDSKYAKIDKIGQGKTGYTYYFEKISNGYNVYRSSNQKNELKTYLFKVSKLDNIKYIKDYVYFVEGNEVKYYHDSHGVKTLFKNTEFDFNESLKYSIYIKD